MKGCPSLINHAGDAGVIADVKRMVQETIKILGGVDVIIGNAVNMHRHFFFHVTKSVREISRIPKHHNTDNDNILIEIKHVGIMPCTEDMLKYLKCRAGQNS